MASPVIEGTSESSTNTAGTSHPVTLPAGIVASDLVLIIMDIGSTSATLNSLANWTEILDESAANGLKILWYTGSGVPSDPTFTSSASTRSAQIAYRISGADKTITPQIGTTATGTSTTPDPPASATPPSSKDYLFIAFYGAAGEEADDDTWSDTSPTNYTPSPPLQKSCGTAGTNLGGLIAAASRQLTTGSAENPGTFAKDVSAAWRAQTITVHPAPPPTTTATAEVSLDTVDDPGIDTNFSLHIRGRIQSGVGTFKLRLYQGSTPIGAELDIPALTTSLADYKVRIASSDISGITDFSDLRVRFRGYDLTGGTSTFEVDQLWLELPPSTGGSGNETKNTTESGAGDEVSSLVVSESATDSGSGSEVSSNTALYTLIEDGSGAEGTPTVTIVFAVVESGTGVDDNAVEVATYPLIDSFAGDDVSAESALFSLTDDSVGTDIGSVPGIPVPVAETGSGNEVSTESALYGLTDVGSSVESSVLAALISSLEDALGSDAGTMLQTLSLTESGSGVDLGFQSQAVNTGDTGTGTDTSQSLIALIVPTESGTLSQEQGGVVVVLGAVDSSQSVDEIASILAVLPRTDTGSGADQGFQSQALNTVDSGLSTDVGSLTSALLSTFDSGSSVETISSLIAKLTAIDSGVGSEQATVPIIWVVTDTGIGLEIAVKTVAGAFAGLSGVIVPVRIVGEVKTRHSPGTLSSSKGTTTIKRIP